MLSTTILMLASALAEDTTAPSADAAIDALPGDGLVQDDEDPAEGSVRAEKESVKKEKAAEDEEEARRRRVIKTIQKKNFMKIGRAEVGPAIGFVANDPFLNRYIINVLADYHVTEVFAIEAQLGYAPILGDGGEDDPDWKPLSKQLLIENSVSPDISKLTLHSHLGLTYAPIYGKAAVGKRIIAFDIYGGFGLGVVSTSDDLVALQAETDPDAINTQNQIHPTTVINVGARIAFNQTIAARIEGKSLSYIEVVNSSTLEMKNNFILQGGVTFFFPGMK